MTNFRHTVLSTSILAGLAIGALATPAFADTILTGKITNAANQPLEGVPVSFRQFGSSFTTSVYTDATGEYIFPAMPNGKYKMWAQAVGFQNHVADVEVKGNVLKQDIKLPARADFEVQMRGDEWMMAMPRTTDEDKRMAVVFRMACMGCHPQSVTLKDKFDQKGWENIITVMSRIQTSGYRTNYGDMDDTLPNHKMLYFKKRLAAWLAKGRGPTTTAADFKPYARPRPKGEETMLLIREYDTNQPGTGLPLFDDGSLWSDGAPSKLDIKNHHSIDGALDAGGDVYFSDDVNLNPYRTVGRIDWKTGKTTNIKVLRRDGSGLAANNHDILTDKDGFIWFGTEGKMYKYDPKTTKLDSYLPPRGVSVGSMLNEDPLGGIWSPRSRFDPKTGEVKGFTLPIANNPEAYPATYGIAADQTGAGWAIMQGLGLLVHMDPKTGKTDIVKFPKDNNPDYALFTGDDRVVYETGGGSNFNGHGKPDTYTVRKPGAGPGPTDSVWGPAWYNDALVKVNIDTREVKIINAPWKYADPYHTQVDKDGNVFTIFTDGDFVGRYNPKTNTWTRFDMPTVGTEAHGLNLYTVNGKTEVTVPYWAAGKAAKVQFRTQAEIDALKAAAKKG